MIDSVANLVKEWHTQNGGFMKPENLRFNRLYQHGLRALEECIEFAIASGASINQIQTTVKREIDKAWARNSFLIQPNEEALKEELADLLICSLLFSSYFNWNVEELIQKKIISMKNRKWKTTYHGVIVKPDRIHDWE